MGRLMTTSTDTMAFFGVIEIRRVFVYIVFISYLVVLVFKPLKLKSIVILSSIRKPMMITTGNYSTL